MGKLKEFWKAILKPFRKFGSWIAKPFKGVAAFFMTEPEDSPVAESLQMAFDEPASFLEHIGALRKHLVRAFLALLLFAVVAFVFLSPLLEFISEPINGLDQ